MAYSQLFGRDDRQLFGRVPPPLGYINGWIVKKCDVAGDGYGAFVRVAFGKKLVENLGLGLDKLRSWGTI